MLPRCVIRVSRRKQVSLIIFGSRRSATTRFHCGVRRLTAAALTAVVAAACSANPPDSTPALVPGMTHIHGLGINPSNDSLYIATHYGLFRIDDEKSPQRVGTLTQDFMGFTVTGPDEFLASGHPDPADRRQPPHLGLIKSGDAGESWESMSLKGSADFHALEYRHARVYGHDSQSGKVMISLDERSWQPRAEVAAVDLAVSPVDADEILATTRQGLLRSTDGAITFAAIVGTPALVFISWPERGPLVGRTSRELSTPARTPAEPGGHDTLSRPDLKPSSPPATVRCTSRPKPPFTNRRTTAPRRRSSRPSVNRTAAQWCRRVAVQPWSCQPPGEAVRRHTNAKRSVPELGRL